MKRKSQLRIFSFDYDAENDSLYVYDAKNKGTASIELDNILVDFAKEGFITGIEILDATTFFPKLLTIETPINKEMLQEIHSCKVEFDYQPNMIFFKLLVGFKTQQIVANFIAPAITQPSPALLTTA